MSESVGPENQVLVTGGSRGIGLAIALALATQGFTVSIAARHAEGLHQACREAEAQGLKLRPLVMDVSDSQSVSAGFAGFESLFGLVHAAGTGAYSDLLDPDDPAIWQQVMRCNLDGAYYCAREAARRLVDGGRLLLVSSTLGLRGMRHSHAYCASKHGVVGLTRALALDLADRRITVNAICPGWVETEMARADLAAMATRYELPVDELEAAEIGAVPMGRWIQPQEVAALATYIMSSAAAALTGQALEISGGLA